ncbi:MAG: amidohydrolase [Deltaproteobacteria bacterium]|nr:amidohydrolase [Deltaproteobacteria bacterium]
MNIIDFHTHLFPDRLYDAVWKWFENFAWPIEYKKYVGELIPILKKEGVTRCVSLHYPHKPGMARFLNEWAYQLGERYPDFVIPFGSVHPDDEDKEDILKECFERFQFKGLKIHCHVEQVSPDDSRMDSIYKMCEEYDRILLIHCGTGPHFKEFAVNGYGYDVTQVSGVERFEKAVKKFPRLRFIVPHLGFEEMGAFVHLLKDYPNLYLDTTMTLPNFFPVGVDREWFLKYPDRILFGTDFPNIPYEWKKEKEGLERLNLGKEIETKVLCKNAIKLLGLSL